MNILLLATIYKLTIHYGYHLHKKKKKNMAETLRQLKLLAAHGIKEEDASTSGKSFHVGETLIRPPSITTFVQLV